MSESINGLIGTLANRYQGCNHVFQIGGGLLTGARSQNWGGHNHMITLIQSQNGGARPPRPVR